MLPRPDYYGSTSRLLSNILDVVVVVVVVVVGRDLVLSPQPFLEKRPDGSRILCDEKRRNSSERFDRETRQEPREEKAVVQRVAVEQRR